MLVSLRIQLYKNALANARITPSDFENDIKSQIKGKITQNLLSTYPISKNYLNEIKGFKRTDFSKLPYGDEALIACKKIIEEK